MARVTHKQTLQPLIKLINNLQGVHVSLRANKKVDALILLFKEVNPKKAA